MLLDRVISIQKSTFVGRWYFFDLLEEDVRDWASFKWKYILSYCGEVKL